MNELPANDEAMASTRHGEAAAESCLHRRHPPMRETYSRCPTQVPAGSMVSLNKAPACSPFVALSPPPAEVT